MTAGRIFTAGPEMRLTELCAEMAGPAESEAELKRLLRNTKAKVALLVALADLSGVWGVDQVTGALTRFADATLAATVDWLMREAARQGKLTLADPSGPGTASGYVVLAMGKQGACELNYSSDIDLIVLYDPSSARLKTGIEPATFFVRLTKRLAAILQDVTEDGYAFRVDLRLRPDPRATQVAIALEAAAIYYENQGQNWERAVMIKARPVAGDIALGEAFLDRLKPYIWRKYLDFAAIADVQSLKRQIHAVKGHGEVAILGHNIKLGRGGIREVEFFVQTQQLIAGGRNPALRGRRTLDMLDALAEAKWVKPEVADELKTAYRFLRSIEHRLQMVNDEQTHALPADEAGFGAFAKFCGFDEPRALSAKLRATFETVQRHYAALFEDAPALGSGSGSLVFTGGEDDPETIETLSRMGFRQLSEVSAAIRGWHFGRYAATRSARARERLTELMPALLASLAETGDADQAFIAFDRFIAGLPTGVQLFSMLKANPRLLDLIATILGSAPRLAEQLSHRPKVLDAVLDPGFFGPLPRFQELMALASGTIRPETPLDEAIDRARVLAREQAFRIGVRILSDTIEAAEAGAAFSALAEAMLKTLLGAVTRHIEARHGRLAGGRAAVLALGKLGGAEMTAASDLDLILIYDAVGEMSDGRKPLSVTQYYTRLTQRLIAAVTAPTSEGILYDIDMRLRPSGNKGPVATSLASFALYHREQSWTWERLALTRARVVAGDLGLAAELDATIRNALADAGDADKLRADVLDMRRLMLKELGTPDAWDIKRMPGGLVDIEFIAQFLQLLHGRDRPQLFVQNTDAVLARLAQAGVLAGADAAALRSALALYQRLTQVLRLSVQGRFDPASASKGLQRLIANAAGTPDLAAAASLIDETRERTAKLFEWIVGKL